jgi:hypothetical protein
VRRALRVGARGGLVARAVFSLLLSSRTVRIAFLGGGQQVDANGALRLIGTLAADSVVLGFVASGFALFGCVRLRAAPCGLVQPVRSRVRRATVALQGLGSLAVASVPLSFAFGSASAGSEQSQQHTR